MNPAAKNQVFLRLEFLVNGFMCTDMMCNEQDSDYMWHLCVLTSSRYETRASLLASHSLGNADAGGNLSQLSSKVISKQLV